MQTVKIIDEVEEEWHHITDWKSLMKGSIKSTNFTRKEIITLYSRFKAMCKLSALENPR